MAYETLKSKLAEAPRPYDSGMPKAFEESMLGRYQSKVEEAKLQKGKAQRWAKGKALLGEATRSLLKESFDPNAPLTGIEMQNRLLTAWAQAGVGEDIIEKFATPQMMKKLMDSQQSFYNRMTGYRQETMEHEERVAGAKAKKDYAPITRPETTKTDRRSQLKGERQKEITRRRQIESEMTGKEVTEEQQTTYNEILARIVGINKELQESLSADARNYMEQQKEQVERGKGALSFGVTDKDIKYQLAYNYTTDKEAKKFMDRLPGWRKAITQYLAQERILAPDGITRKYRNGKWYKYAGTGKWTEIGQGTTARQTTTTKTTKNHKSAEERFNQLKKAGLSDEKAYERMRKEGY